jgi:hypothetical protein
VKPCAIHTLFETLRSSPAIFSIGVYCVSVTLYHQNTERRTSLLAVEVVAVWLNSGILGQVELHQPQPAHSAQALESDPDPLRIGTGGELERPTSFRSGRRESHGAERGAWESVPCTIVRPGVDLHLRVVSGEARSPGPADNVGRGRLNR